jgi:hypothetical protein
MGAHLLRWMSWSMAVMKGGAASDMFGNMQSPGIQEEEQS